MSEEQPQSLIVVDNTLPHYYTNVVRITSSINDLSLMFGRAQPVGMTGNASTMSPECLVHVSPVQAKSIFLLLRQQLKLYEERWGEIPVAPDLAEKFGSGLDE